MAETMSIQQRIAALNLNQVGQSPKPPSTLNKPSPPPLPRSHSTDNERTRPEEDGSHVSPIGNLPAKAAPQPQMVPPALPTRPEFRRPPSQGPIAPSLPPRKAFAASIARRDSSESISSTVSATSSISGLSTHTSATSVSRRTSIEPKSSSLRPMAPGFDAASLPSLPLKQPTLPTRPGFSTARSSSNTSKPLKPDNTIPNPPSLPARRGSNPVDKPDIVQTEPQPLPAITDRPKKSALSYGLNKATEVVPPVPQRPNRSPAADANVTPPVPLSSRPDLTRLQASKPKPSSIDSAPAKRSACLRCRDFSGPDQHAARFPRESIPSTDVAWLANQLTDMFDSPTDKARAIFTWLHHNIAYNADAFFSGKIQPSTPAGTISSGLAVCEGYASLFTAMAMHAGLESVVIGGHGKGFGYKAVNPGESVPPFNTNHAWNAVKIDGGEWKLIESCWGAGHLDGNQKYNKHFSPQWFVMSNDEFGSRHFPKDQGMFFRSDGRVLSWEDYMVGEEGPGENVGLCEGMVQQSGLSSTSFLPKKKHIRLRGVNPKQRVQFQFQKLCEHWDGEKMGFGKPYVFVLNIGGKDGRKKEMIPFSTNGQYWWCDMAVEDLGCARQTVSVFAVTLVNGQDARGMTPEEVKKWIGRRSMSWQGIASYQLV